MFITNYRPVELKEHVVNHRGEVFLKRAAEIFEGTTRKTTVLGSEDSRPFEGLFEKKERDVPFTSYGDGDQVRRRPTAGALAAETAVRKSPCLIFARREEDEDNWRHSAARVRNDDALTAPGGGVGAGRTGCALAYAAEVPDRDWSRPPARRCVSPRAPEQTGMT